MIRYDMTFKNLIISKIWKSDFCVGNRVKLYSKNRVIADNYDWT